MMDPYMLSLLIAAERQKHKPLPRNIYINWGIHHSQEESPTERFISWEVCGQAKIVERDSNPILVPQSKTWCFTDKDLKESILLYLYY